MSVIEESMVNLLKRCLSEEWKVDHFIDQSGEHVRISFGISHKTLHEGPREFLEIITSKLDDTGYLKNLRSSWNQKHLEDAEQIRHLEKKIKYLEQFKIKYDLDFAMNNNKEIKDFE